MQRKPKPPKPATQLTMLDKSTGYCDACHRVTSACIWADVRKPASAGEKTPLDTFEKADPHTAAGTPRQDRDEVP